MWEYVFFFHDERVCEYKCLWNDVGYAQGGRTYLRIKQTKIDTRFKAETRKMTPHAGK